MELQQHLLTKEIFEILSEHSAIAVVHVNAIWTLINLSSKRCQLKEHISESNGIIQHVLKVMEIHRSNKNVQIAGLTLLSSLAKVANCRSQFLNSAEVL